MYGTSFIRAFGLSGVALLALGTLAGTASAGGNHNEPPPVYEDNYSGPPMLRHIPGLRILFGDYALSEDEYNALYGDKKQKKKRQFDETYYEPQPTTPATPAKPKTAKPPAKAAAPGDAAMPQNTASAAAKPLAEGPLSCEKATSVVSGYGFSSVEASSCTGKLYAFNAKRDGKSFAIKLDPASGELTEVKKLP